MTGAALLTTVTTPSALAAGSSASTLPPVDAAALTEAISGLPSDEATGALLQIRGRAGCWTGTSGVADLSTNAPVPADAHFRIGSITKIFTAVVVLQLAAEHRIDLDRPVQHYLPGVLPAGYPDITVAQLLDHTSGLPHIDFPEDPQWMVDNRYTVFTPDQVLATATRHPMNFAPGTAQQYTNTNYIVAGMLVEKVTGRAYGDEVRDRILRRLDLRETSVPGNDPDLPEPYVHGYIRANGTLVDVTSMNQSIPWAAGGMISTAADLDRFFTALFRGELLPARELGLMFTLPPVKVFGTGQPAFYSEGLLATKINGVTVWGKTGTRYGYTSGVFATRDLQRRIVYSVNTTSKDESGQPEIIWKIANAATAP
ncbi:serine hydrolase [Amycolatopsis cynarae]|uniref:Serine hydrolase n=1 Tax=Amycolatopsis cynarae TaxID=2995223 RepID=A0ABY7BB88_9PSEU|nr:serine hydrolase domain-containing protein [Amycolatopsis sp. HUAS 11-8]WAL69619.1 serine hydrolase [Amycolatopsis sp. HUAS 11-8]